MTVHLGDLVGPLVDGQLDHERRDRALGHVARCADCQREVATHRLLKARLLALGGPELPPGAVNRLLGLPATTFSEVGAPQAGADPAPYAAARPAGPVGSSAPPAVVSAMNAVLASTAAQLAHFGAAAISGRAGSVFPGRARGPFGVMPDPRRDGLLPVPPIGRGSSGALVAPASDRPAMTQPTGATRATSVPTPPVSVANPVTGRATVGVAAVGVSPVGACPVGACPVGVSTGDLSGSATGPTSSAKVMLERDHGLNGLGPVTGDGDRPAWRSEPGWTVRRTVLGSAAALAAVVVGGVALAGGPPSGSGRTPTSITPVSASFAVSRTADEVLIVPGRTGMTGSGVLNTVPIALRAHR